MVHYSSMPRRGRTTTLALAAAIAVTVPLLVGAPAHAVTTGNGSLVYAPPNGSSFNDEGGDATGTAYAKVLSLKYNGNANGKLIATFDDARLIKDVNPSSDPKVDTQACLSDPTESA